LKSVRELLTKAPERLGPDGTAFDLTNSEGFVGASKILAVALPAERNDCIASPAFKSSMGDFRQAIEEMARGFLEGPYEMGTPQIPFNNQTLSPTPLVATTT